MAGLICGFVGLGLIGGSIARALKKSVPDARIVAYDVNREALLLAEKEGVADITASAIDGSFSDCDYLFLCAPVQRNDSNLAAVKKVMDQSCIRLKADKAGELRKAVGSLSEGKGQREDCHP